MNLRTPCWYWEAAKRGGGHEERTPYTISLESHMVNTGDFPRNAKGSGTEVRETPTKPQGPGKSRIGHRSRRTGKPCTPG